MRTLLLVLLFGILLSSCSKQSIAQTGTLSVAEAAQAVNDEVIEWRRHFHENPELSNREFETAKSIEQYLRGLGLEVKTGMAHTGVIGYLEGGQPGPTIGLRADIDGLPVTERVDIPFASKKTTTFLGKETGVMHACGHDTHIAMLMGAAKILSERKAQLRGNVVFIFQPAEEGAPPGEEGGAELMVKEGLFDLYPIEVVFGQHISAGTDVGTIEYRKGGIMAASDRFEITINGKQTHGSRPWAGIDPVTVSAQMILALQNIVSRQTELTKEAAVISVGKMEAGVRSNIIPESATLIGTIRTLDVGMQQKIHEDIRRVVKNVAEAYNAEAEIDIQIGYPVTFNDHELTEKMLPSLQKSGNVNEINAITGAEDFSFFAMQVPGLYFFVGGKPLDVAKKDAAPHHTPDFYLDETGMQTGVQALVNLTLDYMDMKASN
ncbi:MAG: amidohydrolase [Saprospiraceae bacterium]|nr:amidohydrolase [Saprospiraceae bacterium]